MGTPATEFVLGPFLDNVMEPVAAVPKVPGRRTVSFRNPATSPGGISHLALDPAANAADVPPVNVYAFYVQPVANVPTGDAKTADWFFASKAPSGSVHQAEIPADGTFDVAAPGVTPSLQPYYVQIVLEFPVATS